MNIKEIVKSHLKKNGLTGLTDRRECSCTLIDLMPCEGHDCILECEVFKSVRVERKDLKLMKKIRKIKLEREASKGEK